MVIHSCNRLSSIDGIPEGNHSLDPSGKEKQSKLTNKQDLLGLICIMRGIIW